jgi:hypothetical protein
MLICRCGLRVTAESLLGASAPDWSHELDDLLLRWDERLSGLRYQESEAGQKGHENPAQLINDHIQNLEARVELLRMIAQRGPTGDRPT